jgi:hypothetical protein
VEVAGKRWTIHLAGIMVENGRKGGNAKGDERKGEWMKVEYVKV